MENTVNATTGSPMVGAATETGTQPATTPINLTSQPASQEPAVQPVNPADVQGLVTRESRKAVEKLLKDAGIMPDDNPEMQLREYKKWLDGQKSELELAQGSVKTITEERDTTKAELNTLKNTLAAIQKGVPADKAQQYIKLTEHYMVQGMSFDAALEAALKDFPIIAPQQPRYAGPAGKTASPPAKEFKDMTYGERLSLKQSNPALYAQMKGVTQYA